MKSQHHLSGTLAKWLLPALAAAAVSQPQPALAAAAQPNAPAERLDWFQDQRYGMFIHWGASVIHGGNYDYTDLSWSRAGNPPDPWCGGGPIPADLYDASYKTFNPADYDPAAWVRLAKEAGMRYIVITARHHDGFSMFDTQQSEFKITHPQGAYRQWIARQNPGRTDEQVNRKTDILRQLADAVHAEGLGFGIYYSEPDWIRPDYRIALTGKDLSGQTVGQALRDAAAKRYQDFMHAQLEELTTRYGKVDILWFDAIKPSHVKEHGWDALWIRRDTMDMIRRNQPGILVNDRHGFEPDYRTPENSDARYIPAVIQESCQRVGKQWAWSPNDRVPSTKWIIDRLVINASRNSNLLMNMGPSPTGVFDENQSDRLREAGRWLIRHAEAIFATRAGPVVDNTDEPGFVTTQKENSIYLHVLKQSLAGGEIALPGVKIESAYRFDHPDQALDFRHEKDFAVIHLPDTIDPWDEIITLKGTAKADDVAVINP
jgi:alpha-L-fucosidase